MQLNFLSTRRTILIIVLIGLIVSLLLVIFSDLVPKYLADSNLSILSENVIVPPIHEQLKPSTVESSFGLPVRLKIPTINVDAPVEYVNLTSGGAMDVPKNPNGVGWFNLGPHPGNTGSAVLAGHYGAWKNGQETVFNHLDDLRAGDQITVLDDAGASVSFVVRESRSFDPEADASSVFVSKDGMSHLNLITCEGTWNSISKSYPMRLVVFADKE